MKKILSIVLVITCSLCLVGCSANTAKDKDELAAYISNELGVDQKEIQYAGEYVDGEDVLVWFVIKGEFKNQYISISCQLKDNQTYRIDEIVKPSVYTTDIVHSIWNNNDVYLVNNSDCAQIVQKNDADEIVSQIDVSAGAFPYIINIKSFSDPLGGSKMMFLDSNGDEIR